MKIMFTITRLYVEVEDELYEFDFIPVLCVSTLVVIFLALIKYG